MWTSKFPGNASHLSSVAPLDEGLVFSRAPPTSSICQTVESKDWRDAQKHVGSGVWCKLLFSEIEMILKPVTNSNGVCISALFLSVQDTNSFVTSIDSARGAVADQSGSIEDTPGTNVWKQKGGHVGCIAS